MDDTGDSEMTFSDDQYVEPCPEYRPDLMAGGTDCANCGWPYDQHET